MDLNLAIQTNLPNSRCIMMAAIAGGAIVASFVFVYLLGTINAPSYVNPEHLYVIYYGHLVDTNGKMTEQTEKILAAKPELVVVPYSFPDGELNLTPEVHQKFKEQGIKVFTYTWTQYTARNVNEVLAEIDKQMGSDVDGILVDEVTNIESDGEYNYYSTIYRHVKQFGNDKLVIMNPGHYKVSEKIMSISDITSLEAEWTLSDKIPWMAKYPPSRFMGVSSNEYLADPSQGIYDSQIAAEKTIEAWNSGIGYHYSTDRYIYLPSWFEDYVTATNQEKKGQDNMIVKFIGSGIFG